MGWATAEENALACSLMSWFFEQRFVKLYIWTRQGWFVNTSAHLLRSNLSKPHNLLLDSFFLSPLDLIVLFFLTIA